MTHNQFFITIPAPAYIARFLTSRYGSIIPLYESTQIGKDLYNLLRYPLGCTLSSEKKHLLTSFFNSYIKFRLHIKRKNEIVTDPSLDHIIVINRYLKDHFDKQLNFFCAHYINPERLGSAGYKCAIESFARMNNISLEEDITFEALKKAEYRFRKKYRTPGLHIFPSSQISCIN